MLHTIITLLTLITLTGCATPPAPREPLQGHRHGIVHTVSDGKTVSSNVVIQ